MVTTGSLHVLALSGAPLLFLLLIAITTTTTLVRPAGALDTSASGTPTDDAIETCSAEVTDCEDDATCFSCMRADTTSASEALECFEEAGIDEIESSTAGCDHIAAGVCCFDLVSEFECFENDPFVAYWRCFLDAKGCSDQALTCDGDTDIGSGVDDDGTDDGNGDGTDDGTGDGTDDANDNDIDDETSGGNDDGTDDGNGVGNGDGDVESAEGASTGGASAARAAHASTLVVAVSCGLVLSLPLRRAS